LGYGYGFQDLLEAFYSEKQQTHDAKEDAENLRSLVQKVNETEEAEEEFLLRSFRKTSSFF